jgi:hypothetical protein
VELKVGIRAIDFNDLDGPGNIRDVIPVEMVTGILFRTAVAGIREAGLKSKDGCKTKCSKESRGPENLSVTYWVKFDDFGDGSRPTVLDLEFDDGTYRIDGERTEGFVPAG